MKHFIEHRETSNIAPVNCFEDCHGVSMRLEKDLITMMGGRLSEISPSRPLEEHLRPGSRSSTPQTTRPSVQPRTPQMSFPDGRPGSPQISRPRRQSGTPQVPHSSSHSATPHVTSPGNHSGTPQLSHPSSRSATPQVSVEHEMGITITDETHSQARYTASCLQQTQSPGLSGHTLMDSSRNHDKPKAGLTPPHPSMGPEPNSFSQPGAHAIHGGLTPPRGLNLHKFRAGLVPPQGFFISFVGVGGPQGSTLHQPSTAFGSWGCASSAQATGYGMRGLGGNLMQATPAPSFGSMGDYGLAQPS